jgi:Zn-dependent protease/predicted transcriptional regulator
MKSFGWSLSLGRIAGTNVYIHWTFILLIGWIFFSYIQEGRNWQEASLGVLFILLLFACVTLHEFGHAFAARSYNIQTKSITLLPIGGVAQMESMPEKPLQELWVALAGPLVNVAIALVLLVYLRARNAIPHMNDITALDNSFFAFRLFIANVILAVFNLIPAFPMDGGRVLRALLALRFHRAVATNIAAKVGQFLAVVFVMVGVFSNFWLIFIGLFIYLGAAGEATMENAKLLLSKFKVRDALMTRFRVLQPEDTLQKASQLLLEGPEKEFLIQHDHQVTGVVSYKDIIKGIKQFGGNAPVQKIARNEFINLSPDMDLQATYTNMLSNGNALNPVFEDGQLVGVLDRENINELILIRQALTENMVSAHA